MVVGNGYGDTSLKTLTRLFAFHIEQTTLGKVGIQLGLVRYPVKEKENLEGFGKYIYILSTVKIWQPISIMDHDNPWKLETTFNNTLRNKQKFSRIPVKS